MKFSDGKEFQIHFLRFLTAAVSSKKYMRG